MYLSHGLPRIILAKGFAPAQITRQASFTPKAAPAGAPAQTTLETAQITLARDSRQRPRPQARPLKKVAPAQG